MYRIIQWATGSIGRSTLRRIIDHPDLTLVGLYVYGKNKIGRDAGEIAKRPSTGVIATNNLEEILSLDADVVVHTPRITIPYAKQNAEVEQLLSSGKNVISVNGYFYPEAHGEKYAKPLSAACERGNSTLAGVGINPGFIAERLALVMSGLCAKVDYIGSFEMVDGSYIAAPAFVFDTMGFGADPSVTDITKGPLAQLYFDLYIETFAYVAEAMGTEIASIKPDHRLTLAPEDMKIAAGIIRRGTVAATEWRWNAEFSDGRRMTHSLLWTSSPQLHGDDDPAHWRIEIKGRPHVHLSFSLEDPDPEAPPSRAGADATAATVIRAIPDVCAAKPGFFRYAPLAPFRERF
jgi:2,4-diaminopentanoate dehydrogenase